MPAVPHVPPVAGLVVPLAVAKFTLASIAVAPVLVTTKAKLVVPASPSRCVTEGVIENDGAGSFSVIVNTAACGSTGGELLPLPRVTGRLIVVLPRLRLIVSSPS